MPAPAAGRSFGRTSMWCRPVAGRIGEVRVTQPQPAARYQIRVEGVLDERWSAWFDGLEVAGDARGQTTITGPVADQAALHGLLAKVRDLGLTLVSLQRIEPGWRP
jgi:hypothetical protein